MLKSLQTLFECVANMNFPNRGMLFFDTHSDAYGAQALRRWVAHSEERHCHRLRMLLETMAARRLTVAESGADSICTISAEFGSKFQIQKRI